MSSLDVSTEGPELQSSSLGEFRVDGWLVDPSLNRVVRGTTTIRVRPQLIDILACLAMHPGRVVSKGTLLSQVWGDRYIAESGISRCMAELRQLLEDDARQPRIIETIPKRGYRLIAPVERVDGTESSDARRAPAPGHEAAPAIADTGLPCSPLPFAAPPPGAAPPAAPWYRRLAFSSRLFVAASALLGELGRQAVRRVAS